MQCCSKVRVIVRRPRSLCCWVVGLFLFLPHLSSSFEPGRTKQQVPGFLAAKGNVQCGTNALIISHAHQKSSLVPCQSRNGDTNNAITCTQSKQHQIKSTLTTSADSLATAVNSVAVSQVDVLYGQRFSLAYDPVLDRYVSDGNEKEIDNNNSINFSTRQKNVFTRFLTSRLSVAFVPAGVTSSYYPFMRWRGMQRYVNAILNVFGTQSLLLGLGMKVTAASLGAWSAATKWVLKDALGKLVRMVWASQMGRRFDSDAKRWRFRSTFCFALGNALEIVCVIWPRLFLLLATLANCCKQVSMLTSSSTRTAIYNSFRDGSRENIADITAKGEAQIAIVDLVGIASGVVLSRLVTNSVRAVWMIYVFLQLLEIVCMYRMLHCVKFRVFNFERMVRVLTHFCEAITTLQRQQYETITTVNSNKLVEVNGNGIKEMLDSNNLMKTVLLPTPDDLATSERIFLPPPVLSRREMAFGSLSRTKLTPAELKQLTTLFQNERFLLVVGENVKCVKRRRMAQFLRNMFSIKRTNDHDTVRKLQENCHIVLHEDATNLDIVKSTLALILLRRKLADSGYSPDSVRTQNCFHLIQEAVRDCDRLFDTFLQLLTKHEWDSPTKSMFGRVHMRTYWPLINNTDSGGINSAATTL